MGQMIEIEPRALNSWNDPSARARMMEDEGFREGFADDLRSEQSEELDPAIATFATALISYLETVRTSAESIRD